MKYLISTLAITLILLTFEVKASEYVTLGHLVNKVKEGHPFFNTEMLVEQREQQSLDSLNGSRDWMFNSGVFSSFEKPLQTSSFSTKEIRLLGVNAGVSKRFWETGGQFSLGYQASKLNQDVAVFSGNPLGPSVFYQHGFTMSYSQPLLKNLGGSLDKLSTKLQSLFKDQEVIQSQERQEQFLLDLSSHYLEWVFYQIQKEIAESRVSLAKRALTQTERKNRSNLVDRVDVLRARDAVKQAEQFMLMSSSSLRSKKAQLSVLLQLDLDQETPSYNLYELPDIKMDNHEIAQVRPIQALQLQRDQVVEQHKGELEKIKPNLSLDLKAGLSGGNKAYSQATDLEFPNSEVSLNFSQPIENTQAVSLYEKSKLMLKQIDYQIDYTKLNLKSTLKNLNIQLEELEKIVALNKEQVTLAQDKTKEEIRYYNQGRSQLAFVIQSQDSEQNAKLTYAKNALTFHQLYFQYLSLLDQLETGISQ